MVSWAIGKPEKEEKEALQETRLAARVRALKVLQVGPSSLVQNINSWI